MGKEVKKREGMGKEVGNSKGRGRGRREKNVGVRGR